MIRTSSISVIGAVLLVVAMPAAPLRAQAPLTLRDAIARAQAGNPDARIAALAEQEAVHRVTQARAGYLPRVDATEAWQRGNQPVFVFGSLLAQRQFTAADFALEALNHPDAVDNFRLAVGAEQSVWDGGATRARVRAAELGVRLAASGRLTATQALAVAATQAFGQVLQAEASLQAARAALEAADGDLKLARDRRDAGLVTEADVLAVEVHRAAVEEGRLRATLAADLARADLNRVMGEPLDAAFVLAPLAPSSAAPVADTAALEAEALRQRPELQQARLMVDLAGAQVAEARASYMPQVFAQGGWEGNGGAWADRSGSWGVGAGVRINLFRGMADKARIAEVTEASRRRALERERAETGVRLEVRAAASRLTSARAREALAATVVAQAAERQRIVRDRYEQGLADVTALLRAAEAVVQAHEQQLRARVDVSVESAGLDRALGR
ncbi:TolC family protein [Luteitalea sp. TBR-22]|uniref:TolC family protein n=1 Tax=Luteitalea sp. TBR-22 TaxID=2802971 RepID=UPI001EF6D0CF|nr:TolC family protein [Luteitalea sp. TBR-22]